MLTLNGFTFSRKKKLKRRRNLRKVKKRRRAKESGNHLHRALTVILAPAATPYMRKKGNDNENCALDSIIQLSVDFFKVEDTYAV